MPKTENMFENSTMPQATKKVDAHTDGWNHTLYLLKLFPSTSKVKWTTPDELQSSGWPTLTADTWNFPWLPFYFSSFFFPSYIKRTYIPGTFSWELFESMDFPKFSSWGFPYDPPWKVSHFCWGVKRCQGGRNLRQFLWNSAARCFAGRFGHVASLEVWHDPTDQECPPDSRLSRRWCFLLFVSSRFFFLGGVPGQPKTKHNLVNFFLASKRTRV